MLIVPIKGDKITTTDGNELKVVSYTNYKEGGPAVFAKLKGSSEQLPIYFIDIQSVNGVRVEFIKGSKVLNALGHLQRAEHLPQPDDSIYFSDSTKSDRQYGKVVKLKLKARSHGLSKGLLIVVTDDMERERLVRLKNVVGIDRAVGDDRFNKTTFNDTYADYRGV